MWTGFEPTLSAIPSELWSPSGVLASSVSTCTPIANWVLVGLLTWGNRIRGCYDLPTNRNRSDHVFKETAMTIGITGASGQLAGLTIEKHRTTEKTIFASGLEWTILRNSLYADFQLPTLSVAAETGKLVHNNGDGACAYVTRADCAAAAAAVLTGEGQAGA